jgi:hypothetical protein
VGAVEDGTVERDPFAPLEASPRGATPLALLGFVAAALALVGGVAPVAGPVGMALGLVAHVKGSRLGMPAAIVSGIAMIAGFSIAFLLL